MDPVFPAIIAGLVVVAGWFVTHFLVSRREDRTRRLELNIQHTERQIGEFYGPLLGLLEQLDTVFRVKSRMVKEEPHNKDTIERIAYEEFFLPLHMQIQEILRSKIYLFEGVEIPDSFTQYIHHFASENILWRMKQEERIQTSVAATNFPSGFYDDLKKDLESVVKRREKNVSLLRSNLPE